MCVGGGSWPWRSTGTVAGPWRSTVVSTVAIFDDGNALCTRRFKVFGVDEREGEWRELQDVMDDEDGDGGDDVVHFRRRGPVREAPGVGLLLRHLVAMDSGNASSQDTTPSTG